MVCVLALYREGGGALGYIERERGGRVVTASRSIQREDLDLEGGAAFGVLRRGSV